MIIKKVTNNNIYLINQFLKSADNSLNSFTYYDKRDVSVIKNHLVTFIGTSNHETVSYGHLDLDKNKVWLGIAVSQRFQSKGFGNLMITKLINFAKKKKIERINLTVLKSNHKALNLYIGQGFSIIKDLDKKFECVLDID